ncbi:NAD dependent epimerase dehydratase family [Micractinium conductrix]|uniref:NAD dependent epimerase dehydratase family n=1 Tax=Micractinium conductrix TaxID=554055 RepID=A0A2P6V232_9CHLO|nr:NAD dependent epimerase dehydratase family [Micractinium conductrix]|eukprot:PSC68148.1 NAD dependent epimerase dehydratase family [Micractinium conductrix]
MAGNASGLPSKEAADEAKAAEVTSAVASAGDASGSGAGASGGTGAEASSSTAAENLSDYDTIVPRLIVFGGNGYVGSRVCQAGLAMGAAVTSVSRSGRPRNLTGAWLDSVEWVQGDALDPQAPWRGMLKGAAGVVSTLGTFGSNALMYRVCGEANMNVMDVAAEAGVPRFAFISVHDYKFPAGWRAQDFLLRGYFQGKRDAEAHMAAVYPTGGVALRPGFIYGTRAVGTTQVHLGWVGAPLKAALSILPTRSLANIPIVGAGFVPPVSVEAVGKAAASAALDPSIPPGTMDVWQIGKFA